MVYVSYCTTLIIVISFFKGGQGGTLLLKCRNFQYANPLVIYGVCVHSAHNK
jgi:hypothetical protein